MEGAPTRNFTVPPGIHFEEVDPQTGRRPDTLTRHPLRLALTVDQSADGSLATSAAGSGLIPRTAGAAPPPPETPAATGITEEDLPLDE
jgi:hypothetical protein